MSVTLWLHPANLADCAKGMRIRVRRALRGHTRRPGSAADIVEAAVAVYQPGTDRHTLRVIPNADPEGTWDRARVARVVDNLLSNAIKYSPSGGDIVLEVAQEDCGGDAAARKCRINRSATCGAIWARGSGGAAVAVVLDSAAVADEGGEEPAHGGDDQRAEDGGQEAGDVEAGNEPRGQRQTERVEDEQEEADRKELA